MSKQLKFVTSYFKQLPGRAARAVKSSSSWQALNKPLLKRDQEESEPIFSEEEAILADQDEPYEFAEPRSRKTSKIPERPEQPAYSVFAPKPFEKFDELRAIRRAAEKEEAARLEAEQLQQAALRRKKLREESDRLIREYDKQMEADQERELQSSRAHLKQEKRRAKQAAYEAAPKTVSALVDEMLMERKRLLAEGWTNKQIEEWGRLARLAARQRKGK